MRGWRTRVHRLLALAAAVCAVGLAGGCRRRESVEATRARAREAVALSQIANLQQLVEKAEAGQLVSADRIAISLSEETAKSIFDASLPQEKTLAERVKVRIESAQPFFNGNNAGLLFQASARGTTIGATARLELGGRLVDFRIEKGRLTASVELVHFKVLDSSLGDMGSDVLESLVRANQPAIAAMLPTLEVPVHLEQSIPVAGLDEGVVQVEPGVLPFQITLAEVIPVNRRLWILLDVKAGPWQAAAAAAGAE